MRTHVLILLGFIAAHAEGFADDAEGFADDAGGIRPPDGEARTGRRPAAQTSGWTSVVTGAAETCGLVAAAQRARA